MGLRGFSEDEKMSAKFGMIRPSVSVLMGRDAHCNRQKNRKNERLSFASPAQCRPCIFAASKINSEEPVMPTHETVSDLHVGVGW